MSCADVFVLLCQHPAATQHTPNVSGDSGYVLNHALKYAADPDKCGKSRGIGNSENLPLLCQVNSLARLKAERDADCWRLWLDGAHEPDPRPWADILAAGDHVHVVRAARVAFLDWADPIGSTVIHDKDKLGRDRPLAARRPWPQAQWPDLRSPPAANGPAGDLAAAE